MSEIFRRRKRFDWKKWCRIKNFNEKNDFEMNIQSGCASG
jgi:hypothetical protein